MKFSEINRCNIGFIATLLVLFLGLVSPLHLSAAQEKKAAFEGFKYRSIGPFRGGRSAAVTGVPGHSSLFYFGSTGGGVWQSSDAGAHWKNISDGYFGGSIGSIAVSQWDNNVIYVGGGEVTVRGNVSHGDGMWRSADKGKTWQHIGLKESHHIPRIRIHPKDANLVYAAVMGHLYGANSQRGVFRSKDGGKHWQKILYINDEVGAVDLVMDPNNAKVLYASTWRVKRTPYSLSSGGEGSGLWKSTDGGDNWQNISDHKGLPKGTLGIIGVTVSSANSDRVWAIIENKKGGVFRSDDAGKTWKKMNDERKLRQRAWYYTRIYADSQDENRVYVVNVKFFSSSDGGKTFVAVAKQPPHGDNHDLWIAPDDPKRMIIANDGGGQVSQDGGKTWSSYHNHPTAQFYRVTTDNSFPYRIYGAQQDNSTVRIVHRSPHSSITERDWEATAGGESGHIAPHPLNPDIVYGGSYDGLLQRVNHASYERRTVNVWPDNPMGHAAIDNKYRFQWNFPLLFSPHNPDLLYAAANVLFTSSDEGQSWQAISGDLTRNDPSTMGKSGGPITKDDTSVEYYGTIFAVAESQHKAGVIWTGSDDGLIHITRDGGANWRNVTPKRMPKWMQINSIEIDPFHAGGLYVAGTRYKSDDFKPYLYKTENYGKSWKRINKGIDKKHFTRVVRADPKQPGLLYAGTESGVYISFDDGKKWQSFQQNLPITPITDMTIKENDLIVATQGRSFWMLDDLTPLHQLEGKWQDKDMQVFKPRISYRTAGRASEKPGNAGHNLPNGVIIQYTLKEGLPEIEKPDDEDTNSESVSESKAKQAPVLSLEILTADGSTIRKFESNAKKKADQIRGKAGFNKFVWNMRYQDAEDFKGMILWSAKMTGPKVVPGQYQLRMRYGDLVESRTFEIVADPRTSSTQADMQAQFDYLYAIHQKLTETHQAIKQIRKIRKQIKRVMSPLKSKEGFDAIKDQAQAINKGMKAIEETLYQTKNRSDQDPLNFPIRLNNKLASVKRQVDLGDYRPTNQALAVKEALTGLINTELDKLKVMVKEQLPAFNALVKQKSIPAIWLQEKSH